MRSLVRKASMACIGNSISWQLRAAGAQADACCNLVLAGWLLAGVKAMFRK